MDTSIDNLLEKLEYTSEFDIRGCVKCSEYFKDFKLLYDNYNYKIISPAFVLLKMITDFCDEDKILIYKRDIAEERLKRKRKNCCLFHMISWHVCSICYNTGIISEPPACCKYSYMRNKYNITRMMGDREREEIKHKKSMVTLLLGKQNILNKIVKMKDKSKEAIMNNLTEAERGILNLFYN